MENKIGYSFLKLKAVDDEKREFVGIASTPEPDRVNDIMVPEGAKFELPIPFLWQHDHQKPIGEIYEAKVTSKGIEVKGRIKNVSAPSQLAARLDEAWVSIKEGLVRGLSIGFRGLRYSFIEDGGIQFDEWDWYELSAVTIPANASGQITSVKELRTVDREIRASLGGLKQTASTVKTSGASGKIKSVKLTPKEDKMNLSDKLKGFQKELETKKEQLVTLAQKSADEGQTFDEADQEAFDALEAEVKALENHIKRLQVAEKAAIATAKPVTKEAGEDEEKANKVRAAGYITVKAAAESVPGLAFARIAKAKALAKIHNMSAHEIAKQLWQEDPRISKVLEKAAVAPGTTLNSTWAAPLVPEESSIYADFAEFLRPATILGKFGQNGVPSLRTVPFRTRLLSQTSGGAASWVGEGNAKPLTKFDFAGTSLDPLKVAAIAVITKELAMDSNPSAELLVRDGLRDATVERLDMDFIDPAITASANVRPASITNGVTPIPSSGSDADAIRCDVQNLLAAYIAANNPPTTGVLIMSAITALALSMMVNPLGQAEFQNITMNGGTLLGFPAIVSEYVPVTSDGHFVIMVAASDIYYADGEITVDMSDQASLQMDSTPDNPTTASTVLVSLWQRNLIGFLVEKRINYIKRRPSAVAVLSGVNWGACA